MTDTKLNVQILSRSEVDSIDYLKVRYALISITDNNYYFTGFPSSDRNMAGLLALKFADVTETMQEFQAITSEQAKLIVEFTRAHLDSIDTLLVNCDAGISRSSGIAAALSYIFNGSDTEIWDDPRYFPNKLVYDTVLAAAGYSNDYSNYLTDIEVQSRFEQQLSQDSQYPVNLF